MGWLRNFVRKRMAPIPKSYAIKMKNRLSAVYYFAGWNLLIVMVICTMKYYYPETEEDKKYPSKYYAKIYGTGDARVIRFKGFTKVGEYQITGTERRDPGTTRESRSAAERELQEYRVKAEERRRREYLGLPEPVDEEKETLSEERTRIEREDLNLLVEETSSL